jgi:hypothetical protein
LAISLSLVLVLGIAVWLLHKYAGLKAWHGVVCALFGFYLATSTIGPGDPDHRDRHHPRSGGPGITTATRGGDHHDRTERLPGH